MIIWLNGAFGSGKTTVAEFLQQKISLSFIYDPEKIGRFLTANLPASMGVADFQDHPEWRQWNLDLLKKMDKEFSGTIIVPMALYKADYFTEIISGLKESQVDVRHFQLEVDKKMIAERLAKRKDGTFEWGMSKVHEILSFFESIPLSQKIDNHNRPLNDVVHEILARLEEGPT